jgi:hypothetical protein
MSFRMDGRQGNSVSHAISCTQNANAESEQVYVFRSNGPYLLVCFEPSGGSLCCYNLDF